MAAAPLPFELVVKPGPAHAPSCLVEACRTVGGRGEEGGRDEAESDEELTHPEAHPAEIEADTPLTLRLTARDAHGNRREEGGDAWGISLDDLGEGPPRPPPRPGSDAAQATPWRCEVQDNEDGTYLAGLRCHRAATFLLRVWIRPRSAAATGGSGATNSTIAEPGSDAGWGGSQSSCGGVPAPGKRSGWLEVTAWRLTVVPGPPSADNCVASGAVLARATVGEMVGKGRPRTALPPPPWTTRRPRPPLRTPERRLAIPGARRGLLSSPRPAPKSVAPPPPDAARPASAAASRSS